MGGTDTLLKFGYDWAANELGDIFGGDSNPYEHGVYHDYSAWSSAERAYVESNPDLVFAYDQAKLHYSPEQIIYGTASKEELQSLYDQGLITDTEMNIRESVIDAPGFWNKMSLAKDKADYFKDFSAADYTSWVTDWKQGYLDTYNEMVELGYPKSQLDPTPWDELTTEDVSLQQQFLLEETKAAELEALAAEEAAAQEALAAKEAAAQEAIEADLDRITELASLRSQSETLATSDVDEYIAKTTQYLKLRGVEPGFTESVRQNLITNRFTEYWSQDNESTLMELANKYSSTEYELPTISERVWVSGGTTITPSENLLPMEDSIAATGTLSSALLNLLKEDEEENVTYSLLGM